MRFNYLLFLCLFLSTNIQVSIQESNVANVYYQITKNYIPVDEEFNYILTNHQGDQYQGTIKDSILYIEDVPFGEYTLQIKEESFTYSFTINKEYLKTQHQLKQLEILKHSSFDTSDSSNIAFYLLLLGISIVLFIIFTLKNHSYL